MIKYRTLIERTKSQTCKLVFMALINCRIRSHYYLSSVPNKSCSSRSHQLRQSTIHSNLISISTYFIQGRHLSYEDNAKKLLATVDKNSSNINNKFTYAPFERKLVKPVIIKIIHDVDDY